jgi:hypothetical protein
MDVEECVASDFVKLCGFITLQAGEASYRSGPAYTHAGYGPSDMEDRQRKFGNVSRQVPARIIAQRREQAQDDWRKKRPQLARPLVPVCTCTSLTALLSLNHHVSSSGFFEEFWPCAEHALVAVAPANPCPVDLGRHSWACAPGQWPWCQPFRTPFLSLSDSSALASADFLGFLQHVYRMQAPHASALLGHRLPDCLRAVHASALLEHRLADLPWRFSLHCRIVFTLGVLLRVFAAVPHWWAGKGSPHQWVHIYRSEVMSQRVRQAPATAAPSLNTATVSAIQRWGTARARTALQRWMASTRHIYRAPVNSVSRISNLGMQQQAQHSGNCRLGSDHSNAAPHNSSSRQSHSAWPCDWLWQQQAQRGSGTTSF